MPSVPRGEWISWKTLPHAFTASPETCFLPEPVEPHILARDSSFSPQNDTAWTTPLSDDTGLRKRPFAQGGIPLSLQIRRYCQQTLNYEPVGQNPVFREALMGFPLGWTDYAHSVRPWFPLWLLEHSSF